MHELSVTQALIDIVKSECKKKKIRTAKTVHLELGAFTPYAKESVLFYFDILREENGMPNTRLSIRAVKGKIRCRVCGKASHLKDTAILLCRSCGSTDAKIVDGRQFKVTKITGK